MATGSQGQQLKKETLTFLMPACAFLHPQSISMNRSNTKQYSGCPGYVSSTTDKVFRTAADIIKIFNTKTSLLYLNLTMLHQGRNRYRSYMHMLPQIEELHLNAGSIRLDIDVWVATSEFAMAAVMGPH